MDSLLIQQERKSDPFGVWLREITPNWIWTWDYLKLIRLHLHKITQGELHRLMLFIPPRHGKSEMVTVRYPVYRLEQDPAMRVIVAAYNQTLAEKFSRKSRKIARERFELSNERTAAEDWETAQGGGLRAVGVGGGITGQGGNLIVIDDPVKSRKEANSLTYRNWVYDWYTDDLYNRQEPGAAIILIMTRWHEDDLAGRILASEEGPDWTVIKLPALAEDNDILGRHPGQALNPDRYDVATLEKIRQVEKRSFWALYQQRPQEQEGDFFKRSWFEIVAEVSADAKRVRYWDKAATAGDGDFTVGCLMAEKDGIYIVEDIVRGQWSSGERDKIMLQTAQLDNEKYPGSVYIWFEQEPGSSGVDAAAALVRMLAGYTVRADKVTGDKAARAEPFASQAEGGNVRLKKAMWNAEYIDELTSFPNAPHDDQVDGSSGAFSKLATNQLQIWI